MNEFQVAVANAVAKKLDEEILSSLVGAPNMDETLEIVKKDTETFLKRF